MAMTDTPIREPIWLPAQDLGLHRTRFTSASQESGVFAESTMPIHNDAMCLAQSTTRDAVSLENADMENGTNNIDTHTGHDNAATASALPLKASVLSSRSTDSEAQDPVRQFCFIFNRLTLDTKLLVLSYVDHWTISAIRRVQHGSLRGSAGVNELVRMQSSITDLYPGIHPDRIPRHQMSLILSNSYPLERRILRFDFRSQTYKPGIQLHEFPEDEVLLDRLHRYRTIADIATHSIVACFGCTKDQDQVREGITLLLPFAFRRWPQDHSQQWRWDYIAWLPREDKDTIQEFLDFLVNIVLQKYPFRWPRLCSDPCCRWKEFDPPRTAVSCSCCGRVKADFGRTCQYILPTRIIDELNATVTPHLARQFVVRKLVEMIVDISELVLSLEEGGRAICFDSYWAAESSFNFWHDVGRAGGVVGVKYHPLNTWSTPDEHMLDIGIFLHYWWLPAVHISGTRFDGTIILKKNPMISDVGGMAMKLDEALSKADGEEALCVEEWDTRILLENNGVLMTFTRNANETWLGSEKEDLNSWELDSVLDT